MSADFKPELGALKSIRPFVFWAQTTLPTVFDDSLSYYEVLTKLTKMVNTLLENTDTTEENVEALATAYDELQAYVNDYFENLDVTTEIDNKLEEWRSAGIIDEMVDSYVAPIIHDYLYGADDEGGVQKTLEDMLADATESLNNALSTFSSDSRQALNNFERDSRDALTDFEDATDDALDAIPTTVDAWLDQNFTNPSSPPIDATLSLENAAAQAKATGERCDQLEDLVLSNNDWVNSVSEVVSNQYVVVNNDGTNPRIANDASSDPLRPMSVANITGGRSYLISCVGNTVGPNTFSPAYAICNLSYDLQDEPVYTILDFYPRAWDPQVKTYEIIRSKSVYIPETVGLQTVNCLILMGNTDITVTPKCGVLSVKTDNTLTDPLLPANSKAVGDALANKLPWPVTGGQKDLGTNGKGLFSNGDGTTRWDDAGGDYSQEIDELQHDVSELQSSLNSIADITINILPLEDKTSEVNGVTVNYKNGRLTLNGTSTGDGGRLGQLTTPFVLPAGTYIFSATYRYPATMLESGSTIIARTDNNNLSTTFTISEDTTVYVGVNLTNGTQYVDREYGIQLESGSVKHDWVSPVPTAKDNTARSEIAEISEIYDENNVARFDLSGYTLVSGYGVNGASGALVAISALSAATDIDIGDYAGCNLTIKCAITGWAGFAFYDKNHNYITGADSTTFPGVGTIATVSMFVPATTKYISFSTLNSWSTDITSYSLTFTAVPLHTAELVKELYQADEVKTGNILVAFDNITCCGDSLTYSQVYTGDSASRQAYVPYPKVIEKLSGTETVNLAVAGYTAIQWWGAYENSITQKTNQCAIIYLGTNAGFTDTLSTDAPTDTPYSEWANTNTGCLAKIVAKFLDVGAKVILVKISRSSGNVSTSNSVIEQVADRFDCGLIEPIYLADNVYHLYPNKSGSNNVHYNDLGYTAFANELIKQITNMPAEYLTNILPN